MYLRVITAVLLVTVVSGLAMANTQGTGTCIDVTCFNQTYVNVKPVAIENAPKYAWRPGLYNRDSNYNRRYSGRDYSYSRAFSWFSSVPRRGPANSTGTVVFNPQNLTWAAYDSTGELVKSGRASGGMGYCSDVGRSCRTPIGRFRVYSKGPANCISRKYPLGEGGAPMPYCMYFNGGYALHGSYDVPNYNASHGCIRLHPPAAQWLHQNFVKVGTVVVVRPY